MKLAKIVAVGTLAVGSLGLLLYFLLRKRQLKSGTYVIKSKETGSVWTLQNSGNSAFAVQMAAAGDSVTPFFLSQQVNIRHETPKDGPAFYALYFNANAVGNPTSRALVHLPGRSGTDIMTLPSNWNLSADQRFTITRSKNGYTIQPAADSSLYVTETAEVNQTLVNVDNTIKEWDLVELKK